MNIDIIIKGLILQGYKEIDSKETYKILEKENYKIQIYFNKATNPIYVITDENEEK
jgi:hypothetical protein